MAPEEITALAREYAEEIYPHEDGEDLGQMSFLRNNAIKHISSTLKMLLRRYVLVERSKFEELEIARRAKEHGAVWLNQWEAESLFPEIAKEVKG